MLPVTFTQDTMTNAIIKPRHNRARWVYFSPEERKEILIWSLGLQLIRIFGAPYVPISMTRFMWIGYANRSTHTKKPINLRARTVKMLPNYFILIYIHCWSQYKLQLNKSKLLVINYKFPVLFKKSLYNRFLSVPFILSTHFKTQHCSATC
jgi:hypothetical protein